MIQLAIIGPTASGKSDLAIKIAKKIDAYILSIDSLSIYKEIDIVSAKPSKAELNEVRHFGIDLLCPNEYFSVDIFIQLYKDVLMICKEEHKNLIIVGGTSFYLKSLIDGLSQIPTITKEISLQAEIKLKDLESCYNFLFGVDEKYMKNISPNDRYRIEKALLIYEASKLTPSEWFRENPPKPIIENLPIYNIEVDRDLLRERIKKRTLKMLEAGLIDEVCYLEQKYTRLPHAMNSIGIVEVLEYLDSKVTKDEMLKNISTHTAQLAKRQQTFNRTQFGDVISAPLEDLEEMILSGI
ncbi:MAG: tRNA (adenosine(37)-N6)-dimethylallyltransferase MiaA [Sulfurimonas sp.]|jgi:tRNA dimethylallyltransferase|uniref:tRNA (adenosine(37)-N6)-dimethylallyltransferase MiaA n=1 Tax=unclassified Sulfurimonas TaxID=2623549 RepID=UPI0008D2E618|nr:tRNA (adenosine(37)-N6)-dimethylallyltransferase MiaA [Sulfurimonas sp. RIFOXYB12_FULL_35_9]OHE05270.1 MAG: tRNA (adenosine(37)-N6)-dimethylallyltransferase MiaA [Sulfurimonas sp. RIFOXYB12_FULL_35_9]